MERTLLFSKGLQESKEDYCGLELYLSPEKGEETAITSDLISEEVKKFGEPESIKIFDHKEGEPVKVYLGFSDHVTTNYVRESLDKSQLGKTRINVRAIFSQTNSLKEDEDVFDQVADRHLRACSIFDNLVTDDLDFGLSSMSRINRKEKWFSEDPNTLGHLINELRGEIGITEAVEVKKAKPSSGVVGKKSAFGGDAKLIDGPDDYAYSKLNPQQQYVAPPSRLQVPDEEVPEEESISDAVDNGSPYPSYGQTPFNYPYNAGSSNNYHYPSYQYQDQYSYHGYPQGSHELRPDPHYAPQQAWAPTNSGYGAAPGHPYYSNMGIYHPGNYPPVGRPMEVPIMHYHHQYPGPQPRQRGHQGPQLPYPSYAPKMEGYYPGTVPKTSVPFHPAKSVHSGTNSLNQPSHNKQSSSDSFDGIYQDGDLPVSVSANSNGGLADGASKNKTQLKRFRQLIEAQTSHVLHVKGLDNEHITADLLNSLFSNFGNIQKLLFVKQKKAAFIVYENPDLATIAKEMLSNLRFMDCHLKITYCKEETFEKIVAKEGTNQLLIPNPKYYRFKDKKISINPPSKTLHLSNIAREMYTEKEIAQVFAEACQVKRIKLLNKKNDDKCMALVELNSIDDSLYCIAKLHNKIIFSRNLKISFTKSKI